MVSPPPIADQEQNYRISSLSQQFALVCSEINVPYLDIFSRLDKSNVWLKEVQGNDGAHPRAAGYQEFAAIVQNWEPWLTWFPATKV